MVSADRKVQESVYGRTEWNVTLVLQTELGEELVQDAHKVPQCQAAVCHHALDLVELRQVGGVQGLVTEHPVDGEVLHRCELLLERGRERRGGGEGGRG